MNEMTAKEAYDIICKKYNERFAIFGCRNYDDFYGFFVAPEGTDTRKPTNGSEMMCVDKRTKKVTFEPIYEHFGENFTLIDRI